MYSKLVIVALLLSRLATTAIVQGSCTKQDSALHWLQYLLSSNATISCHGNSMQEYNVDRYWGEQYSKNASVVVYPTTSHDVSLIMQALQWTPLGQDFAFVSGAHSMTNASSAYGLVMDLTYLNQTSIIKNYKDSDGNTTTAIMYRGCSWGQVYNLTGGTGYTAVAARDSEVGVGGFSTGGGIGFIAGAYGFAIDRLLAMDVVLPDGTQITATKNNQYSDLFWALQGGGGQFGIVTAFYQDAAPEPLETDYGVYIFEAEEDLNNLWENAVDFFNTNEDPFSLIYWAAGYFPPDLSTTDPAAFGPRNLLATIRFANPEDPDQLDYNQTFASVFKNLDTSNGTLYQLPFSQLCSIVDPVFPYGYRRVFAGGQVPTATVDYFRQTTSLFNEYIQTLLTRGEDPLLAVFALQYMFPDLNGNLPKSDADTAWPHATVGHQSLSSFAWTDAANDGLANEYVGKLNDVTYALQAANNVTIPDYPNYISPGASGKRVWGDNVPRLCALKQKYDPGCLIHQGRVFASEECVLRGFANVFPE